MAGEWLKLSTALAGQKLGIKEVDEGIWVVSLMQYDLGYFDLEQKTLQPSTARSPRDCHPCLRYGPLPMCPGWTIYEVAERETKVTHTAPIRIRSSQFKKAPTLTH